MRKLMKKSILWALSFFRRPYFASPDVISAEITRKEIFKHRIYHNENFKIRDKGAIIFDVGGNIGQYSAWAAEEYDCKKIISLEASPISFKYLARNLNRLAQKTASSQFVPVKAAVSNVDNRNLTIYHRPHAIATSTLREVGIKLGIPYQVRSTTVSKQLKSQNIDYVDLLKIDVEGHFMEVLQGIDDDDFRKIGNITLECDWTTDGAASHKVVEHFLQLKGYFTEVDDPNKTNNVMVYAYREC